MDNCRFKVYNYNPAVRADAYRCALCGANA